MALAQRAGPGATPDLLAIAVRSQPGTRDLCLDAGEVSFVDCSGLGTLVELARGVRARGHRFEIMRASDPLMRLSRSTGQSGLLGIGR